MTVTITRETPSQLAVAKANESFQVTDARKRVITLAKPPVLRQFKLIEMLGESASNSTYVSMVLPLLFVTAIDDNEHILFQNKLQLDALIQQLGQEGINAVLKGVEENFGQSDPEAEKAALKK